MLKETTTDYDKKSEHWHQVRFVSWFRKTFPGVLIHSVPNGGARAADKRTAMIRGAQLKAEGQTPGVPDLHIPKFDLWIEFKKASGGSLSKVQKDIIKYLETECGDTVLIGKGVDDAIEKVIEWKKSYQQL